MPKSTSQKIYGITAKNGVHFIARIIEAGTEHHGRTVEKALIAFYDARHSHTEFGQFITDYYAETIAQTIGGLDLHGGVDDWKIDAHSLYLVRKALGLCITAPYRVLRNPEDVAALTQEQARAWLIEHDNEAATFWQEQPADADFKANVLQNLKDYGWEE